MGGRGAAFRTTSYTGNIKNAIIPSSKLKNYLLNPSKDPAKSRFFHSLGYNMSNYKRLRKDILQGLKQNKLLEFKPNRHGGVAFQVNMDLGISKKGRVVTGWMLDKNATSLKFITARPHRGKKDEY